MTLLATAVERVRGFGSVPLVERGDAPLALVLPGLFLFSAFLLFPLLYLFYLSFTDAAPQTLFAGEQQFIGFENYVNLLTTWRFWNSLGVTWLFLVTSVLLKIAVGIGMALVLDHHLVRGKRLLRAMVIVPLALPPIFVIAVWRGMFSTARYGVINQAMIAVGLEPVAWLQRRWMAFLAYNVTEVWLATPFMFIIIVSALQSVPEELHDAAKVDGAGYLSRFVHVTLPSIKRPVWFASILTAAASFQQFLIPFVFNQGGPARRNELILVHGYREAFAFNEYGQGAAIMIMALLFIGAFMWLNVKKGRLAEGIHNQ